MALVRRKIGNNVVFFLNDEKEKAAGSLMLLKNGHRVKSFCEGEDCGPC